MSEKRRHTYSPERKSGRTFSNVLGALGGLAIGAAVVMNMPGQAGPETAPSNETIAHQGVVATVFWVGESGSKQYPTHNRSSAWVQDWVKAYGGVDDPKDRCGYKPCDFTPRENPFYFALPYNDIGRNGQKPSAKLIPWYNESAPKHKSQLRNHWIKVTANGKTVYGQWADVGPFKTNDHEYVLGDAEPLAERAGLDVSPAMAGVLGFKGSDTVGWEFVDAAKVPKGPWREIVSD